jgi:hypothetical protein
MTDTNTPTTPPTDATSDHIDANAQSAGYTVLLDALKLNAQDNGFSSRFEEMLRIFDEESTLEALHDFAKQCRAKGGLRGRDPGQWRPRAYATLAVLTEEVMKNPPVEELTPQRAVVPTWFPLRKKVQLLAAVTATQEASYRISLNEAADFFLEGATEAQRAEVLDVLRDRDIACGDRLLASLTGTGKGEKAKAERNAKARTPKAPKSTPEADLDTAKAKAPATTLDETPAPVAPVVAKDPIDAAVDAFEGLVAALASLVATSDPSVEQRLWDAVAARSAQVTAPFYAVALEVESPNRLETLLSILGNEVLSACASVVATHLAAANVVAELASANPEPQPEPAPEEPAVAEPPPTVETPTADPPAPETPMVEAAPEEPALDYDPLSALLD